MRIAIDVRNVGKNRTGSEVVVIELFRALFEQRTDDTFYLLTDTDDEAVVREIKCVYDLARHQHVKIISCVGGGRARWILWHMPRFVRRHKIDVFHTEYIVPFRLPHSVRVITHIHDVSFCESEIRPLIARKDLCVLDALMPRSIARADCVVAVSRFTAGRIAYHYPASRTKMVLIENACAPLYMSDVSAEDIERVRDRYQLPEKFIFSLGTMQPRKNIPFLISAFGRIAARMPDMDLVLSGKQGHNWDHVITDEVKEKGIEERIHFTGYIKAQDLPAVYAAAYVFAYPSLYEGFGIPLLEAMWQDVPVVASQIQVHREVGGKGVYYASPYQIDRYAEALYTVCTDEAIRAALRKNMVTEREKYNWSSAAKKLHHTMRGLVYTTTEHNKKYMAYKKKSPSSKRKKMIVSLLALLLVGGIGFGIWKLESIANTITSEGTVIGSLAKRLPGADTELKGEAQGRINIALLGMRGEGVPGGGQLTDTIMVASIIENKDPASGDHPFTISFFSIPRDLLVTLPSGDQGKVNSVFFAGERFTRGAGLSYVTQTLYEVLGQEIHYAASINFQGFEDMIDALGGVRISLDKPFSEPLQFNETHVCDGDKGGVFSIPTGEYEIKYDKKGKISARYPLCANAQPECGGEFNVPAGDVILSGEEALCYVRSRVTSSDFDRARRQQQVLTEIRAQALSADFLSSPTKIGEMLQILGDNVETNMELWEMEQFITYYERLDQAKVVQRVLDDSPSGLLEVPSQPSGFGYVLTPRGGDYSEVHQAFQAAAE